MLTRQRLLKYFFAEVMYQAERFPMKGKKEGARAENHTRSERSRAKRLFISLTGFWSYMIGLVSAIAMRGKTQQESRRHEIKGAGWFLRRHKLFLDSHFSLLRWRWMWRQSVEKPFDISIIVWLHAMNELNKLKQKAQQFTFGFYCGVDCGVALDGDARTVISPHANK